MIFDFFSNTIRATCRNFELNSLTFFPEKTIYDLLRIKKKKNIVKSYNPIKNRTYVYTSIVQYRAV